MTHVNLVFCIGLLTFSGNELNEGADKPSQHQSPKRTRNTVSTDLNRLINDLRRLGATVKLSRETVSQPFFAAPGRIIQLNDESVWVFSYSSSTRAEKDAGKVARDGMTIGNLKPSWLNTPHFFRRPLTIILFLGDDKLTLDLLARAAGPQFAGG